MGRRRLNKIVIETLPFPVPARWNAQRNRTRWMLRSKGMADCYARRWCAACSCFLVNYEKIWSVHRESASTGMRCSSLPDFAELMPDITQIGSLIKLGVWWTTSIARATSADSKFTRRGWSRFCFCKKNFVLVRLFSPRSTVTRGWPDRWTGRSECT